MTLTDATLVGFLSHGDPAVRSSSLELLSLAYSNDSRWLPEILRVWDTHGIEESFPEFPLLSHLEVPVDRVGDCIVRAETMVQGRSLTDRVCRCGGKLIEAISVASPALFRDSFTAISRLKSQSKIFFRIDLQLMRERLEELDSPLSSDAMLESFQSPRDSLSAYGNYPKLEGCFLHGQADAALQFGFAEGKSDQSEEDSTSGRSARRQALLVSLQLGTRQRLLGYEHYIVDMLDHSDSSVSDLAAIALARCRTDTILSLIADRFANFSRGGQLRAVEVLYRGRLPKTTQLLRFLRPHAEGPAVQNALRLAEVMQFDIDSLEDWLEALMLIDDETIRRIRSYLSCVPVLIESLDNDDRKRVLHLVEMRMRTT